MNSSDSDYIICRCGDSLLGIHWKREHQGQNSELSEHTPKVDDVHTNSMVECVDAEEFTVLVPDVDYDLEADMKDLSLQESRQQDSVQDGADGATDSDAKDEQKDQIERTKQSDEMEKNTDPIASKRVCGICHEITHRTTEHQCSNCNEIGDHRGKYCPWLM